MLFKPAGGKQPTPQPWPLPPEMSPYRRIWILILGAYASAWLGTMPRASEYAFLRQWASLKPLKCSGGLAMMVNLASPSKHFEGFRPAYCQGKAYTAKTLAAIDGGAHRQQSTESGRGRNGEDDDNNGQGRQQQRVRTTTMVRTTTVRTMAMRRRRWQRWPARTVRITGKDDNDVKDDNIEDDGDDGKDNRQGRRWQQGQRQ